MSTGLYKEASHREHILNNYFKHANHFNIDPNKFSRMRLFHHNDSGINLRLINLEGKKTIEIGRNNQWYGTPTEEVIHFLLSELEKNSLTLVKDKAVFYLQDVDKKKKTEEHPYYFSYYYEVEAELFPVRKLNIHDVELTSSQGMEGHSLDVDDPSIYQAAKEYADALVHMDIIPQLN